MPRKWTVGVDEAATGGGAGWVVRDGDGDGDGGGRVVGKVKAFGRRRLVAFGPDGVVVPAESRDASERVKPDVVVRPGGCCCAVGEPVSIRDGSSGRKIGAITHVTRTRFVVQMDGAPDLFVRGPDDKSPTKKTREVEATMHVDGFDGPEVGRIKASSASRSGVVELDAATAWSSASCLLVLCACDRMLCCDCCDFGGNAAYDALDNGDGGGAGDGGGDGGGGDGGGGGGD